MNELEELKVRCRELKKVLRVERRKLHARTYARDTDIVVLELHRDELGRRLTVLEKAVSSAEQLAARLTEERLAVERDAASARVHLQELEATHSSRGAEQERPRWVHVFLALTALGCVPARGSVRVQASESYEFRRADAGAGEGDASHAGAAAAGAAVAAP